MDTEHAVVDRFSRARLVFLSGRRRGLGAVLLAVGVCVVAGPGEVRSGDPNPVSIRVVDPSGAPLREAEVELMREGRAPSWFHTDTEGRVEIGSAGCEPKVSLRVSFPRFCPRRIESLAACEEGPFSLEVCLDQRLPGEGSPECRHSIVDLDRHGAVSTYNARFLQDLPGPGGHASKPRSEASDPSFSRCSEPIRLIREADSAGS